MPVLGTHQAALYAAETEALRGLGQRWRTVRDAQHYLDGLLESDWFRDLWPHFEAARIERRGGGSRWSTCDSHGTHAGVVLIADGALDQATVLHEMAHLLLPDSIGHRELFAETLLTLVRHEMGFNAFAALFHGLRGSSCFADIREGINR